MNVALRFLVFVRSGNLSRVIFRQISNYASGSHLVSIPCRRIAESCVIAVIAVSVGNDWFFLAFGPRVFNYTAAECVRLSD